jgi:hypothetical protein
MVSDAQLDADKIRWDLKNIPRAFWTQSSDAFPSSMNDTLHSANDKPGRFTYRRFPPTVQITSGSASHFLSASTLLVLRCGRASDQIAIDQSMTGVGHPCSARASNAFPSAGAPSSGEPIMA